ncbi:glycosyltransferase family 2 protein [Erythrobacter crassostreae]|uniref:Glycosyltransferase family 2 protein n=1 Tax=Erythrobacter crassostreae TaxID=2828328 RepID=A0A9X1F1A5_9SPHN|nr:glycosyltransferase family 2 protein [Erythrobacter crassostrea]MBV7258272.1 glycosyltransferase family 2 protein [Erythrobacter crassostrea]
MTKPETSSPRISILIVGYNSAALIAVCIGSIAEANTKTACEILFIDNGDGSTESLVAATFPNVIILPSRGNIGFAAANNLLAKQAKGDFLLLLNPDVELQPCAIDALMQATLDHSAASAWGGVTLDANGAPDLGNRVHIPSISELASRLTGKSQASIGEARGCISDARVEVLSGSFVMLAREAWDQAGGLDERYFLYCEEVDLFVRLASKGHSFWRVAAAQCYHNIGHGEVISPIRMLYRAAGTMQFARIHWSRWRQELAFLLLWAGALQRFLIGRMLGRWRPKWPRVAKGHRDIALRPSSWRYGYDPERGLLSKVNPERPANAKNAAQKSDTV